MNERPLVHVDLRIAQLAAGQHGLASIDQLRGLGLGRGALDHRLRTGRLHRLHRGVYSLAPGPPSADAELLAAVMACGEGALLGFEHAVELWDLLPPWITVPRAWIRVIAPPGSRRGRRPGIAVHRRPVADCERTVRRGIPVTTPARTLVDYATRVDARALERAIDQALTGGTLKIGDLREAAQRRGGRPGGARLRNLLEASERDDSLTRSELEEAFLRLVRSAQLPSPALNVMLHGHRVDAVWSDRKVIVELDGYRWHRTRSRQESDRCRELELRRAGWCVLRYSARQVFDQPLAVVADLTAALTAGGEAG